MLDIIDRYGLTDKDFIRFDSVKSYNLGAKQQGLIKGIEGGFSGTGKGYNTTLTLLEQMGFNINTVDRFLWAIMNTTQGAILEGYKESFTNTFNRELVHYLGSQIATLLFDDFNTTLSDKFGDNLIHIFNLSHAIVPLSFLAKSAGQALLETNNMDDWLRFHFKTSRNIINWKKKGHEWRNEKTSQERWLEQQKQARTDFEMSIYFMTNFVQKLSAIYE